MELIAHGTQTTADPVVMRLDGFRQTLRDREQRAFDRVLHRARDRASAAPPQPGGSPTEVLFLSVLIEQELSIMRMEAAVEELCWSVLGHAVASGEAPQPRGRPDAH